MQAELRESLLLFLHETGLEYESTRTVHFLRIIRQAYLVNRPLFDGILGSFDREVFYEEHGISVSENRSMRVLCLYGIHGRLW